MARALESNAVIHAPKLERINRNGFSLFVDPERGNWIGTDRRGAAIVERLDGSRTLGQIVADYGAAQKLGPAEALLHADTLLGDLGRRGLVDREAFTGTPYEGRGRVLKAERLRELWIHTNNSCNLECRHCLVNSGPDGDRGLPADRLMRIIDEALELGTEQFFFTGGEPFVRRDIFELIAHVTAKARLIILTNGLLFKGERLEALRKCDPERLSLQVSLDGPDAASNDPIRGKGTFDGICEGIRAAVKEGFEVVVTTAVCRKNATDIPRVTRLAAELGARAHHLLWPHRRGRALDAESDYMIDSAGALGVLRRTREAAAEAGIVIDNWEAFRSRAGSPRGVRHDLSNAGYESLCVYSDGAVYPSAALANLPDLRCGSVLESPLGEIWRSAPVLREIRALTVASKPECSGCPIRYICGGGDIEHSFAAAPAARGVERMRTLDPYCGLYKEAYYEAMEELCHDAETGARTGFHRPVAKFGKGDGIRLCHDDAEETGVALGRSACVLSLDLDHARAPVRTFYAAAAEKPQEELCCPLTHARDDVSHIPKEVLDVSYGCGSPVSIAAVTEGEVLADLGSGGGIDCFIAAKKVGPKGRVYGIDMTDPMLEKARRNAEVVARRLGYANVEFRKGYLEEIPLSSSTADVLLSNCVINLSPDKRRVFREMWRVLRDFGRIVISDIVSDRPVPARLERDAEFRGQCLGGALTQEEFVAELERAGFYGIAILEKTTWKEVEGIRFHSVTVRGFKFEKRKGCTFVGQWAVYMGPYQSVMDEEGHLFPRNQAVEICTDTAAKLSAPPYRDQFVVFDGETQGDFTCCDPEGACC